MHFKSLPLLLFFVLSYGIAIYLKGWSVGLYTLLAGISALMLTKFLDLSPASRKQLAYLVFFITPLLTAAGQIGTLTGFGRNAVSLPWQGIAFATSGIAFQIYQGGLTFSNLFGSILQPLRLISGPLPIAFAPSARITLQRFQIYAGWIILGGFFYGVLAAGIAPLLILRHSTESLDILFFAIIFEIYVYLNFCGISLIVSGILNLLGIRTGLNFNAPFSARNLIGYWQRWHISFSQVLKVLFFLPGRNVFGTYAAVIIVFLASSVWHGATLNFLIWGMFHALGWLITYYFSQSGRGRLKQTINALLMILFILTGRLIFSEINTTILLTKVINLFSFNWTAEALALQMSLDAQTGLTIAACFGVIMLEIFFPKKMFHYKMLRKNWVLLPLLALTLAYGSNGFGSVYGSR